MRLSALALAGALTLVASAAWPVTFRVYVANGDLQESRVPTLDEDEPGCHSMLLNLRVYRVAQIGFKHCTVYAEKDCEPDTEVPVSWKQEEKPVTQFTQGDRWFLVSTDPQGHEMGSWYCAANNGEQ